jgi:hypothetical protein
MGCYEFIIPGTCLRLGDMNSDGLVDGDDIQPFVDCVLANAPATGDCACGDLNGDMYVTPADVPCMVRLLLYGTSECLGAISCNPADCNTNSVPDVVDIIQGTSQDCNTNGVPDECDIAGATSADANTNGIPDECEGGDNLTSGNSMMSQGEGGSSASQPAWSAETQAFMDWYHAHPREDYPEMTSFEYGAFVIETGVSMGALDERWLDHAAMLRGSE